MAGRKNARKTITEEEKEKIIRMYTKVDPPWGMYGIANMLGVSLSKIREFLTEEGIQIRKPGYRHRKLVVDNNKK